VRELYHRLKDHGFKPWLDVEDLDAGRDWKEEIREAVRSCDAVVVCLSKGSIRKESTRIDQFTLNFAGPREGESPGIYKRAFDFIDKLLG
jgi:hypothetical protein